MDDDNLFKLQYGQIWQQRRQHVTLYWAIPTVAGGVIAFFVSHLSVNGLNKCTVYLLFGLLLLFSWGAIKIFLRHNFFQRGYGLVLKDMDRQRKPLEFAPQFGEDLVKYLEDKNYFKDLDYWEKAGAKQKGIHPWLIIIITVAFSILLVGIDLTNLTTKILGFPPNADSFETKLQIFVQNLLKLR